jgi:hypothetical protein
MIINQLYLLDWIASEIGCDTQSIKSVYSSDMLVNIDQVRDIWVTPLKNLRVWTND